MTGLSCFDVRVLPRLLLAVLLTLSSILVPAPAQAASERALYLYYTHTKETARIVFKRNGQYVQSGLNELNQFLRDWRRNEPTKMDPRLFDLVWEVYQDVGGSQPINIVSAYRSPATNAMLASNSSGVADNSQHMRGTAMDFFIPGVPLAKLRAAAMRRQVGGVGYYPTSGSPFVHLDTGSVRAWPRMTRAQLKEIFPDGRTMHLPTDGTPLSQEGYQIAMAEWKRCHAFPCNGSSSGTQVADGGSGRTLMDVLFGGGDDAAPAAATQPTIQTASAAPARRIEPVMPVPRPAGLGGAAADPVQVASIGPDSMPFGTVGSAPLDEAELDGRLVAVAMPVPMPDNLRARAATALPTGDAVTALAALTAPTMPTPRVIMTDPPAQTLSAYVPTGTAGNAALAAAGAASGGLRLSATPVAAAAAGNLLPALPLKPATSATRGLFEQTFDATDDVEAAPLAVALAAHVAGRADEPVEAMRRPALVAPDLEHVAEVFIAPAALDSTHFAVIFDRDEADFDPTPEMGRHVLVKGVGDADPALGYSRFAPAAPLSN